MIDPLFSNQEMFSKAVGSFGISASKFAVGAAGMHIVGQQLWDSSVQFKESVKTFAKTFTIANFVMSLEQVVSEIHSVRLEMTRTYGDLDLKREFYLDQLQKEQRATLKWGDTIQDLNKHYGLLAKEFGDFRFIENDQQAKLIRVSSVIKTAFQISEESSAKMVANFSKFQKMSPDEIQSLYSYIADAANQAGVSHTLVAEQIANSSTLMYTLDLRSKGASKQFAQMAASAASMGLNIGEVVENIQKFRHIAESVEMSALASAWNINLDPLQLAASARIGGDPMMLHRQIMQKVLDIGINKDTGKLNNTAVDLFEQFGPALGMDREKFMNTAMLYYKKDIDLSTISEKNLGDLARDTLGFFDRLDAFTKAFTTRIADPLASVVFPAVETIVNLLGFIAEGIGHLPKLLTDLISGSLVLLLLKGIGMQFGWLGNILKFGFKGIGKVFGFKTAASMATAGGGAEAAGIGLQAVRSKKWWRFWDRGKSQGPDAGFSDSAKKADAGGKGFREKVRSGWGRATGRFRGGSATEAAKDVSVASSVLPKFQTMLGQAIQMVAFSTALWILSKAFQGFSQVDWKGFLIGIGAMGAFAGVMALLSSISVPAATGMGILSVGMLALGASLWMIASGFEKFTEGMIRLSRTDYSHIAKGIGMLGWAITSFFATGGISSGLAFFTGGGNLSLLKKLGEVSEKYSDSIMSLGNALMAIGVALEKINVNYRAIESLNMMSGELSEITGEIISSTAHKPQPIIVHSRVNLDGRKVGDGLGRVMD